MHLVISGTVNKKLPRLCRRKAFMQSEATGIPPRVPNSNNPVELGTPQGGARVCTRQRMCASNLALRSVFDIPVHRLRVTRKRGVIA